MSSTLDFIDYTVDQIASSGEVTFKRMFGEFMVYVNNVPIFLVCDNTVYVKKINELDSILSDALLGIPYPNAKEHFIVDIDDKDLSLKVVEIAYLYRLKNPTKKSKK
jgi:TfoX/Sxy family transcriptional regulator of competence genes